MSSSERIIVGGVEGGATHSKLMLFEAASMKALATSRLLACFIGMASNQRLVLQKIERR